MSDLHFTWNAATLAVNKEVDDEAKVARMKAIVEILKGHQEALDLKARSIEMMTEDTLARAVTHLQDTNKRKADSVARRQEAERLKGVAEAKLLETERQIGETEKFRDAIRGSLQTNAQRLHSAVENLRAFGDREIDLQTESKEVDKRTKIATNRRIQVEKQKKRAENQIKKLKQKVKLEKLKLQVELREEKKRHKNAKGKGQSE